MYMSNFKTSPGTVRWGQKKKKKIDGVESWRNQRFPEKEAGDPKRSRKVGSRNQTPPPQHTHIMNLDFLQVVSGFPSWYSGTGSACQCNRHKKCRSNSWVRKSRKWRATPVFLPGKFHRWRSLADYNPRGHKESDTTERLSTHAQVVSKPEML